VFKYKQTYLHTNLHTLHIERDSTIHHGTVITKYVEIHCHFVSVSNRPSLVLFMLVNLNHKQVPPLSKTLNFYFPGLHRTNLIFQNFSGPG